VGSEMCMRGSAWSAANAVGAILSGAIRRYKERERERRSEARDDVGHWTPLRRRLARLIRTLASRPQPA